MDAYDITNDLLKQLSAAAGQSFELDDSGMCVLSYKQQTLVLYARKEAPSLWLYAPVLKLRPDSAAPYEKLLQLNFVDGDLGGASFAIDAPNDEVVLGIQTPCKDLDYPSFEALVENLILSGIQWSDTLSNDETKPKPKDEGDDHLLSQLRYKI
jgi:hypothetical protein